MRDDLERIWKEAVVAESRYYPGIGLVGIFKVDNFSVSPVKYIVSHSSKPRATFSVLLHRVSKG
jgi:hypothetical protein